MRAWVMSDLHTETSFYSLPPTPADVDVIVIAGDVADGHYKASRWLASQAVPRGKPVLFVPGNHEFFGHDLTDEMVELYHSDGVDLLHEGRPVVHIDGVPFIGATLWTDYRISGDEAAARGWARRNMPDFFNIDVGMRRVGTRDLSNAHDRQLAAIREAIAGTHRSNPAFVVTHHAPHKRSLRSSLFLDSSDGSFASDLEDFIIEAEPAVWVHGHVHHSRDFYVSATRIVCNPRGNVTKKPDGRSIENKSFIGDLVVEF